MTRKSNIPKIYLPVIESGSIIAEYRNIIPTLLVVHVLVYLSMLVLSGFFPVSTIKPFWYSGVIVVWSILILIGGSYLIYSFFGKRRLLLYLVYYWGFMIFIATTNVLSFLGLFPLDSYIPIIMPISVYVVGLGVLLFEPWFLSYKSYLAQSLRFAEGCLLLFIGMGFSYSIGQFRTIIGSIFPLSFTNIPDAILAAFKIAGVLYFIKIAHDYLTQIKINDENKLFLQTLSVSLVCAVIVTLNLILTQFVNYWWIGTFFLLTSVFYVAQNPTKRKSSRLVYALFALFVIFYTFYTFSINPLASLGFGTKVHEIIAIPATLIATTPILRNILLRIRGKRKIGESDVEKACKEIIQRNGLGLQSINDILSISIISGYFEPCNEILQKNRSALNRDLKDYFFLYLSCAQQIVEQKGNKEEDVEFQRFVTSAFPITVNDFEIWDSYTRNEYIRRYIDAQTIEKARPKHPLDQAKKAVSNLLVGIVLVIFVLGQVPAPIFEQLPSMISKIGSWNNLRATELQLRFTEAFAPYRAENMADYYTYNAYQWVLNWETLEGIQEDNRIILSPEDLVEARHWFQFILDFHKQKDGYYYAIQDRIGNISLALGEYDNAIASFESALDGIKDADARDQILSKEAQCYLNKGEKEKAIQILTTVTNNPNYLQSKLLLADIYFAKLMYDDVIRLLQPLSIDQVPTNGLLQLGDSYLQVGDTSKAKSILEKIPIRKDYNSPQVKSQFFSYRGEVYFREQNYFSAAESFYYGLSNGLRYGIDLPPTEEQKILADFKVSIDTVKSVNASDYRVNLWYFVYYFYNSDATAWSYFQKHLSQSPKDYEKQFTDYILNLIDKSQKK